MKNSTIKKIAFGLLLAGYASSSAFALVATTNGLIQGNAPVLSKVNGDAKDHTVSVTFTSDSAGTTEIGANENVKVGDYMKISYKVLDKDGDTDQGQVLDSLKVFTRTKDSSGNFGAWQPVTDLKTTFNPGTNENGVQSNSIIVEIDDRFAGVDQIGFQLQERTEFGLPNKNEWLSISDVWSSELPEVSTGDTAPDSLPSDPKGPGDQAPGKGPIVSDTFKVGIFKYDADDKLDNKVDYAQAGATVSPKYGEKFGAVVWNDADKNGSIDDGELIKTSAYTYQWTLADTYESVAATDDVLQSTKTTADGDTIYLGSETANHNSVYNTTYKAGAQGYKLKVTANTAN